MKTNKDIVVLVGDLGFSLFDQIRDDYPERFINCGAAEAAMSDIAVGLALSDKIPVVYSITPFLLYRCFETWRTYVNHEILHVILLGSGRDNDYHVDGFSHFAGDDIDFMRQFKNITSRWPTSSLQATQMLENAIIIDQPWYINLKK